MGMDTANWTLGKAIGYNLKNNWMKGVGAILVAQLANNVAKKMGVYRMANKTIRTVGAGNLLKF